MNFKLVSKQNIGVVMFLLLTIIISQSRMFDFIFNSALGRGLFIIFLLIISYCNKILGIVTVLLAILMINHRDFLYYEGFTDASGNPVADASGNPMADASGNRLADASGNTPSPGSGPPSSGGPTMMPASSSSATEGFDLLGTENNMKRGKKSNSIPVNNSVRRSGNVEPYSSSSFDNSYSMF